jgi:hypothetical protein
MAEIVAAVGPKVSHKPHVTGPDRVYEPYKFSRPALALAGPALVSS